MRATRRSALVFVAIALLASFTPLAGATEATGVKASDVQASASYFYAADLFENDDTTAQARDITALMPAEGSAPRLENHTIDVATSTASYDQDWLKLTVTSGDVAAGTCYLFETFTAELGLDTVMEVYGPGAFVPGPGTGVDTPNATLYNDDGAWYGFPIGNHVALRPSANGGAGTYFIRVHPYFAGDVGPYTLRMKKGSIDRISGADRIATAIAISQQRVSTVATPATAVRAMVLANSMNFPDALSGGLLAGMGNGSLLLTPQSGVPASVIAEIQRSGANRVYVLGGTGAISNAVVTTLQGLPNPPTVLRVQGDTRIQTAVEIALQAQSDAAGYGRTLSTFAIIANAYNFPDALAASPVSSGKMVPILLTGASTLDSDTAEALVHLGTTDAIVVGGTGAISETVVTQLGTALGGSDHVLRLFGPNRYATSKAFASWACDLSGPGVAGNGTIGTTANSTGITRLAANRIGIASGETFPDALAGGTLCGRSGFPLLLTPATSASPYIFSPGAGSLPLGWTDFYTDESNAPIMESRVFGGTGAVSAAALRTIDLHTGR